MSLVLALAVHTETPKHSDRPSAAVQGNNEVSMWDMETGDRKFTLWASSAPPLSELQVRLCVAFSDIRTSVDVMILHLCFLRSPPPTVFTASTAVLLMGTLCC